MKNTKISKNNSLEVINKDDFDLLNNYLKYCESLGNSSDTIINRKRTINNYLLFINLEHNETLNKYDQALEYVDKLSKDNKLSFNTIISRLKHFFNYLYDNNLTSRNISLDLYTYKVGKNSKIPNIWSFDEINNILSKIDTKTAIGKRDMAIIYLAIYSCLRSKDIVNIKLSDIDFREKSLNIIQSKNKKIIEIPLSDKVIKIIIDYIKNGRPNINNKFLFLSCIKNNKLNSNSTYLIIQKYLNKTSIDLSNRKRGLHTFRHTTLNYIFNECKTSVSTITEIAGHINPNSLNSYIKTDINHLRKLTLEIDDYRNGDFNAN